MIINGRGLSEGIVEGRILLSEKSVSFSSEVDWGSGEIITRDSKLYSKTIKDRIYVMPGGIEDGSEDDSFRALSENGCAPKAIIMDECGQGMKEAAKSSGIPLVDMIDIRLLRNTDEVLVNGNEGFVEVRNVQLKPVVTCFLRRNDRILILKRSDKVLTSKGKWAGVSGYVEEGEAPSDTALKEIREETGIENPELVGRGENIYVRGKDVFYQIHTFLFEVDTDEITIDWEHTEYKWILPEDVKNHDTVPKLTEALESVLLKSP